MSRVRSEALYGLRLCVLGLAAIAAASTITTNSADAGYRHRYRVLLIREAARSHRHADTESYSPLFASIVVDGNDGEVLHATNADAPRHPASLTKIMTLYLLFERLEAGKIRLDSQLKVSEHAAEQAPTKLGLRPGQTIAVDDAIKAVVTKSANDAAVTIAENLAGDEGEFARLMTQKARALGMSRTTYVNASGLPDDDQITTARDQALLGRAIQERFPHYYKYFSTPEFVYHGREMRNHNHLLGEVGGVDGIKTGYTRASGFNLVTSVHRDGRYIVAVVLGGHSAGERDARMRELISTHIREASLRHIAPPLTARAGPADEPQVAPLAKAQAFPAQHADSPLTDGVDHRSAGRLQRPNPANHGADDHLSHGVGAAVRVRPDACAGSSCDALTVPADGTRGGSGASHGACCSPGGAERAVRGRTEQHCRRINRACSRRDEPEGRTSQA